MPDLESLNWNDLKVFVAIARCGSTIAAAKALGVNQSTVQRRLVELEKVLGCKLVQRHAAGYRLTESGEDMVKHAMTVDAAVAEFTRQAANTGHGASGVIRVTCPEPIIFRITQSGLLDRFHDRYPEFRVEFVMSDKYLDLAKGDADVALRSGDTDDNDLVGRKIADSFWTIYASRAYIARNGKPDTIEDLKRHDVVGFDQTMANHRAAVWLHDVVPDAKIVARNNSVLGLIYAVKSGIGLAPLPTAIGDAETDLVRVLDIIPALSRSWRLLAHPDVRNSPRVRAFFDFIVEEIEALKPILTG